MENNTSISRITAGENILYVKVVWKDRSCDLFHINIFDGNNCWSGRLSNEFAQKYMQHWDENDEDYVKTVKKALTATNSTFEYKFSPIPGETSSAKFSWKKTYKDSNSTAVLDHGAVPVHLDNSITKNILIDFLIEQNNDLRNSVEEYENSNLSLSADLEECRKKLEQFIDIKTSLESSMYGKFVQLLNSKKKRIKLLEQNLQEFEETGNNGTELD